MKTAKRMVLLGMIFCLLLTISGFAAEVETPMADDAAEIVIDSDEDAQATEESAEELQPEEEPDGEASEEPEGTDDSEQIIRIEDAEPQTATDKPIRTQSIEVKSNRTLRILAIGNSFTNDSMRYVAQIAKSAGYNLTIGVLWKSSSSLENHLDYIVRNSPQYTYDKFSKSSNYDIVSHSNVAPDAALGDENWDLVFLQQVSYLNGDPNSILDADGESYVSQLAEQLRAKISNRNLSISWLMGWAYAKDYESTYYARYNYDQTTMYRAIANTTKNVVWASGDLDSIIPVGTAIQNVRSSYIGDNLNRDGRHLTYSLGRYTAGLAVAASIGINISNVSYFPTGSTVVSSLHKPMLVQAVKKAIASPFKQTKSTYTKQPSRAEPTIQSITNVASGAKLKWKSCKGASSYRVSRKAAGGSWEVLTSSTTKTSYTDQKAKNGTKYAYRVLTHFDSNLDTTSAQKTSRWLRVPESLKAVASGSTMTVSWKANSKATGYRIRYSTSKKMTGSKTVVVKNVSKKKIIGLKSGKTYYFQIRAQRTDGKKTVYSAWSGTVSSKRSASNSLAVPTAFRTAGAKQAVALSWKASSKATGYQIRYSTSKKMTNSKTVAVKNVSKKKITGLKSGKTYYFQIRACRTSGTKTTTSAWSGVTAGKTK